MAGERICFILSMTKSLDVKAYYFYSERGLPGAVILYNPRQKNVCGTRISSPKPVIRKPSPPNGLCRRKPSSTILGTNTKIQT